MPDRRGLQSQIMAALTHKKDILFVIVLQLNDNVEQCHTELMTFCLFVLVVVDFCVCF